MAGRDELRLVLNRGQGRDGARPYQPKFLDITQTRLRQAPSEEETLVIVLVLECASTDPKTWLACIAHKSSDQPATLRVAMRAGNLRAMQARLLQGQTAKKVFPVGSATLAATLHPGLNLLAL